MFFFRQNTMPIIRMNYMIILVASRISKYLFLEANWICCFLITLILTSIYFLLIKIKNNIVFKIFFGYYIKLN